MIFTKLIYTFKNLTEFSNIVLDDGVGGVPQGGVLQQIERYF